MLFDQSAYKFIVKEPLKPIPITCPQKNRFLFYLRCCFDLQLKTISAFLKSELNSVTHSLLDIGAGNSPWKNLLRKDVQYIGLDVQYADQFNMSPSTEVLYYSGNRFPFLENTFHHALCTEVLEHVLDTKTFLREIYRCLKPNGKLILTVPWSARRHHAPYDYFRFTPEALEQLLNQNGFVNIKITPRGNDWAVLFNKTLCLIYYLFFPSKKIFRFFSLPIACLLTPSFFLFFIMAHISLYLNIPSYFDPLGFSVTAQKPSASTKASSNEAGLAN